MLYYIKFKKCVKINDGLIYLTNNAQSLGIVSSKNMLTLRFILGLKVQFLFDIFILINTGG